MACPPPLVVWDFDWSLVNENSDTWVVGRCDGSGAASRALLHAARTAAASWTLAVDVALRELHSRGVGREEIAAELRALPVLGGAIEAFRLAASSGARLAILSDANTVYIETLLSHLSLLSLLPPAAIVTNPAWYDGEGRLHVSPHQPVDQPHACPRCPANMCKGAILQQWLTETGGRCVYVGDGSNDFCAATKLREGDLLLARKPPHDGLLRCCLREPGKVAATVMQWSEEGDGKMLHAGIADFLKAAK